MDSDDRDIFVRGFDGCSHWQVPDWTALVGLASLSTDPTTVAEWAAAARRYLPHEPLSETGVRSQKLQLDALNDGRGWCVLDLVGRTVVANPEFELPRRAAAFQNDDGNDPADFHIVWFDLASDWGWETVTDKTSLDDTLSTRYELATREPRTDWRAILLGKPCWDFFADAMLARPKDQAPTRTETYSGIGYEVELTRSMHRDWLMTPRDDLQVRTPREVLLCDRERLLKDLEHRAEQWTQQRSAPPALSRDSFAYRRGYAGTTEAFLYFHLVRNVVNEGWKWLLDCPSHPSLSDLSDFLSRQSHLWLGRADHDDDTLSPEEQIDLERQRVPRLVQPHDVFDDCPLCRAQAEGAFGPTFMWIHEFALDYEEDFAFSLYKSYDDWSITHFEYSDEDGDEDSNDDVRPTPGLSTVPVPPKWHGNSLNGAVHTRMFENDQSPLLSISPDDTSVWERCSLPGWDAMTGPQGTPESRMIALGFPVSELAHDLNLMHDGIDLRQELSNQYVAFSGATNLQTLDSLAGSLRNTLETVAMRYPHLLSKSADLQCRIDEVLRHFA